MRGSSRLFSVHPEQLPRSGPRPALHAAVSTARANPVIRDSYQRLIAAGKTPKIALTACMLNRLLPVPATSTIYGRPASEGLMLESYLGQEL